MAFYTEGTVSPESGMEQCGQSRASRVKGQEVMVDSLPTLQVVHVLMPRPMLPYMAKGLCRRD